MSACSPKHAQSMSGVEMQCAVLQGIVDTAVQKVEAKGHSIKTVLVYDHMLAAKREKVNFKEGQDVWWQDVVPKQSTHCPVEWMGAEEPLFKVRYL